MTSLASHTSVGCRSASAGRHLWGATGMHLPDVVSSILTHPIPAHWVLRLCPFDRNEIVPGALSIFPATPGIPLCLRSPGYSQLAVARVCAKARVTARPIAEQMSDGASNGPGRSWFRHLPTGVRFGSAGRGDGA